MKYNNSLDHLCLIIKSTFKRAAMPLKTLLGHITDIFLEGFSTHNINENFINKFVSPLQFI